MKKKVFVLKIEEYDSAVLKEKIKKCLLDNFALDKKFSPQDKILLKPNLLMEARPDEAIVTHPALIEAVGNIFKEMNYPVFIADSPGGFLYNKDMDFMYAATGVKEIADKGGFKLLYPTQSKIYQDLPLCWWAVPSIQASSGFKDSSLGRHSINSEANGFKMINLPKLKTHDIMVLTLATKNLYGCISGVHKSYLHKLYPKTPEFSDIILKLYQMLKPALNIVDGILGLEGNGPAKSGKPRKLGLVAIGDDALYTDYAVAKLLGLEDRFNPLIKKAKEQGIFDQDLLELVSEIPFGQFNNFKFPSPFILNSIPTPLISLAKVFLLFRPFVNLKKCTGCSRCVEICPKNAIQILDKKAHIDYKKCIMCMCCGEMCRFGAVDLEKNFFWKAFLLKLIDYLNR